MTKTIENSTIEGKEENIEEFIYEYGKFCENMSLAISHNNEFHLRRARKYLEKLYELIPEENVKGKFPRLYNEILEYKDIWNERSVSPEGITNKEKSNTFS